MVLDLLVLEEEICQGRLSLDNFKDGVLLIKSFDEGYLMFDADSYDNKLPEGYCLHYGLTKNKEAAYFLNTIDLAEIKPKWINGDLYTKIREHDGLEVRRVSNKIQKKDFKKKLSKKEWEEKKKIIEQLSQARFSEKAWSTIKEYIVPVKRARKLVELPKEVKRYTHKAIRDLENYFSFEPSKKLPDVKFMHGVRSYCDVEKTEIIIGKIQQNIIYEEAGHFLHFSHAPKKHTSIAFGEIKKLDAEDIKEVIETNKEIKREGIVFPLEMFFRIAVEEAIGFYCSKIGDKTHSVGIKKQLLYGFPDMTKDIEEWREIREDAMVGQIMRINLGVNSISDIKEGRISSKVLQGIHQYLNKDENNISYLGYNLGITLGERLWKSQNKDLVKDLILSQEDNFPLLFFNAKKLSGL